MSLKLCESKSHSKQVLPVWIDELLEIHGAIQSSHVVNAKGL